MREERGAWRKKLSCQVREFLPCMQEKEREVGKKFSPHVRVMARQEEKKKRGRNDGGEKRSEKEEKRRWRKVEKYWREKYSPLHMWERGEGGDSVGSYFPSFSTASTCGTIVARAGKYLACTNGTQLATATVFALFSSSFFSFFSSFECVSIFWVCSSPFGVPLEVINNQQILVRIFGNREGDVAIEMEVLWHGIR